MTDCLRCPGYVDKRARSSATRENCGSVLPGRGGGSSKRWLNTGCHLLTVALSSSHWFPVKCIAETRRSAPKRHKHELIFEGIEGDSVRDTIDARTGRDAGSRTCVVSVVSWCVSARIEGANDQRINERFRMTETTMT